MMNTPENPLQQRIAELLDDRAATLDELTLARLGAARRRATNSRTGWRARVWRPLQTASGLALAASLVLGLSILLRAPVDATLQPSPDELEALAEDDAELFEKLEFFRWLDEEGLGGESNGGSA
jgi:hypothetical protein